ncbi:MAG: hypothetical protein FJ271_22205 [Planctomycetes bacterium]|nr:hypothetical protein [Planctomycetota bacterium]
MPKTPCTVDQSRLDLLRPCMASDFTLESARPYIPFDPFADPDGFPLCSLSKQTVVYSCGVIARKDDKVLHEHPPREIKLCQRLAAEAARVVDGLEVGMGSEGTPAFYDETGNTTLGTDGFSPFFVTAIAGEGVPKRISEALVRTKFGGVIFPKCSVQVEALKEKGDWWASVRHWYSDDEEDGIDPKPKLDHWRRMIDWFNSQQAFTNTAFVMIGDAGDGGGSLFPRLALGLTKAGSLAGILGLVVHT